jgi:hypothetical protein
MILATFAALWLPRMNNIWCKLVPEVPTAASSPDWNELGFRVYSYRRNFWKGQVGVASIAAMVFILGYSTCMHVEMGLVGFGSVQIMIARMCMLSWFSDESALRASPVMFMVAWMPWAAASIWYHYAHAQHTIAQIMDAPRDCCTMVICSFKGAVIYVYFPMQWLLGATAHLTDTMCVGTFVPVQVMFLLLCLTSMTNILSMNVWEDRMVIVKTSTVWALGQALCFLGLLMAKVSTHGLYSEFQEEEEKQRCSSISSVHDEGWEEECGICLEVTPIDGTRPPASRS